MGPLPSWHAVAPEPVEEEVPWAWWRGALLDSVLCPECGTFVPDQGGNLEAYCEDCGSHPADMCPNCEWYVDLIFAQSP